MIFNSEEEVTAKAAAIYDLLVGYHQLTEKLTDAFLDGFVRVVDDCSPEAVRKACLRIASGRAPGVNSNFPPTPADVAISARLYQDMAAERVPLYSGILEMDWGHGRVDMRGLTVDEQDRIIEGHGTINGRNAAMMSLEEKREAIKQPVIEGDKRARPRLQRMADQ